MILDATTKSLEVLLAGAVTTSQPVWVVAWADHTTVAFTPGSGDGLTNSTTAVPVVAAPISGVQRQVKFFSLFNNDTASVIATVRVNNNGTFRILVKITLAVGDTLEWSSEGWRVITANGTVKSGVGPAGATGEIQFNKAGVLGADPDLLWDEASNELRFGSGAKARMAGQNRFRHLNAVVRAKRTTNQTITTATWTAVALADEDYDPDNMHDNAVNNTRVTINVAGKYALAGFVQFSGSAAGAARLVGFRVNGATFIGITFAGPVNAGVGAYGTACDEYLFAATDYVELMVYQDTGGDLNITGTNSLCAHYIGE